MTITTDQIFSLIARQNEVIKRVKNGGLTIERALAGTQGVLDGSYPTQPAYQAPSWYVSPEQQLQQIRQLNKSLGWGFTEADFPSVISPEHRPTRGSVLMLSVALPDKGKTRSLQRTFDELWNLINLPGFTKWRWEDLRSDDKHLQYASGQESVSGIRWIWFDPTAYQGISPESALAQAKEDDVRLAGTEVLMAAALFPEWMLRWNGDDSPYPNLAGLQFYWNSGWSDVPYFFRFDDARQLKLNALWAVLASRLWSSPVVREC